MNNTEQLAAKLADIYTGLSKRFGQYTVKGINKEKNKHEGRAETLGRGPTLEDYVAHIEGKQRMGIVPLMDDGKSIRFAAIDIDVYPAEGEDKDTIIDAVVKVIGERPLFVTRSKSGGCHVWLLSKEPIAATLAFRAMRELAGELGYGNAEVFPKQTVRIDDEDVGNWINIPFYGDICKCRGYSPEDDAFYDVPLEQFVDMVESVDQPWVDKWLEQYDYDPLANATKAKRSVSSEDFIDGPPCLQSILRGYVADGSSQGSPRNELLFDIGLYYKRKYETTDTVFDKLVKLDLGAATIDGKHIPAFGLGDKEIKNTVMKTLFKKDYHYRCNRDQLKQHCRATACRKLSFGIEANDEAMLPNAITIYEYGPGEQSYYLSLSNFETRLGPFSGERIGKFAEYQSAVVPLLFAFPRKMSEPEWQGHVTGLMQLAKKNVVYVKGASTFERFQEKLGNWVLTQGTFNTRHMKHGRPYLHNGLLMVSDSTLMGWLRKEEPNMVFETLHSHLLNIDPAAEKRHIDEGGFTGLVWCLNVKENQNFKQGELDVTTTTDSTSF